MTPSHIVPSRMNIQCNFHTTNILQVNSNMQNALWALRLCRGQLTCMDGGQCLKMGRIASGPCRAYHCPTLRSRLFSTTGETELVSKYVCEMYDESTNVNKKSPQRPSWTWALFAASDEKLELRPHRNGCEKPTKLLLVGANVFVHCDNVYVFNLM